MLMDPHPSRQHAGLHNAVWQLQQEVTRPKARFEPTSPKKSGVDEGANQVNDHWVCSIAPRRCLSDENLFKGISLKGLNRSHQSNSFFCYFLTLKDLRRNLKNFSRIHTFVGRSTIYISLSLQGRDIRRYWIFYVSILENIYVKLALLLSEALERKALYLTFPFTVILYSHG